MYVIIVYDVSVKRVSKICAFLRTYLNWIQNSVFEGELTKSELKKIERTIKELVDPEVDSIIIYTFSSNQLINRKIFGVEKAKIDTVI